jgi:hypothetical protein
LILIPFVPATLKSIMRLRGPMIMFGGYLMIPAILKATRVNSRPTRR